LTCFLNNEIVPNQYRFDLTSIDFHRETLIKAQLRLFKLPNHRQRNTAASRPLHLVRLDIIDIATNRVVCSRMARDRNSGWQVFPLTEVVRQWRNNKFNKGIRIQVNSYTSENNVVPFSTSKRLDQEPILVVYTREDPKELMDLLAGQGSLTPSHLFNRNDTSAAADHTPHRRVRRRVRKNRTCRVDHLSVPLHQIGWLNFIHPKKFVINQCKGRCGHHSSKAYSGQTNHALLQALMAAVTETKMAAYPCCAPTKFESGTALLVENHNQNIKVIKFEKLRVIKCACL